MLIQKINQTSFNKNNVASIQSSSAMSAKLYSQSTTDSVHFGNTGEVAKNLVSKTTEIIKPTAEDIVTLFGIQFIRNVRNPHFLISIDLVPQNIAKALVKEMNPKMEDEITKLSSYTPAQFEEYLNRFLSDGQYAAKAAVQVPENVHVNEYGKFEGFLSDLKDKDKSKSFISVKGGHPTRIGIGDDELRASKTMKGYLYEMFKRRSRTIVFQDAEGNSRLLSPYHDDGAFLGMDIS